MILVGDVGGTRTRLALAAQARAPGGPHRASRNARPRPTSAAVAALVRGAAGKSPPRRSAPPGPVAGGRQHPPHECRRPARRPRRSRTPRASQHVRARQRLSRHRGAIPHLPTEHRCCPAAAARASRASPIAVLGPGHRPRHRDRRHGSRRMASPSRAKAGTRTSRRWTMRNSKSGSGCAARTAACRRRQCSAGRDSSGSTRRLPVALRPAPPRSTPPPGAASPRRFVRTRSSRAGSGASPATSR